jgi:hypothetical protein
VCRAWNPGHAETLQPTTARIQFYPHWLKDKKKIIWSQRHMLAEGESWSGSIVTAVYRGSHQSDLILIKWMDDLDPPRIVWHSPIILIRRRGIDSCDSPLDSHGCKSLLVQRYFIRFLQIKTTRRQGAKKSTPMLFSLRRVEWIECVYSANSSKQKNPF